MSFKVVVVDDDAPSASVVAKLLQRLSCTVTTCTDPMGAVDLALSDEVDMVSLDLSMPGLDGYRVLALIRSHEHSRRLPSVPVITVTGSVTPRDRAEALAGGFAAHLGKPVLLDALSGALALALTLRSELHHTRYSVDSEDIQAHWLDLIGQIRMPGVQTAAGLALALEQHGCRHLRHALTVAFEGGGDEGRHDLDAFAQGIGALGARCLAAHLADVSNRLRLGGAPLETAAVLARAELDRVIFTLREMVRH